MATQDIMPYDSHMGGHTRVHHFRMGAATTSATADTSWRQGEVLLQNVAAGDIDVIADGTENVTTNHYIAAAGSADLLQTHGATSGAATHDILVPVYPLTGPFASTFITRFVVTGSDVLLTSAEKDAILVGDTVGLWRDNTATGVTNNGENGRFAVDTGATGLKLLRKLDANGNDCDGPNGGTCVFFVVGDNQ